MGASDRAKLPSPPEWSIVRLGDLFDVQQGKSMSPAGRASESRRPFLRTSNVLWGRIDLTKLDEMHFSIDEMRELTLQPGDLLVCEGGDVGRTAMWRGERRDCFYQNHRHRLRAKRPGVIAGFVMYWLQAAFTKFDVYSGVANRTTIPNLSASRLKDLPIPLPPTGEQSAIDYLLSRINARVQVDERRLQRIRDLSAATLAKVFREGLRREPRKASPIGEIPESWNVLRLGDVAMEMKYGTSLRCTPEGSGQPVLRIPNVVQGRIDVSALKYAEIPVPERERLRLRPGDLLFVRTNGNVAYIGRCAVYEGTPADAAFASYLIRVRVDTARILPAFVQSYLAVLGGAQLVAAASSASDGKYNIDTGGLRRLTLPVPDLDEQRDIVRIAEALDRRLKLAQQHLQQSSALFTSMLTMVMTGKVRLPLRLIGRLSLRVREGAPRPQGKVDETIVAEAVRRIVDAVAPALVILFGSAARGEMTSASDLDFLVVKAGMARRDATRAIRERLRGLGTPVDVVVVSPETVERYRDVVGHIVRPALREGRVVYAA